MTTKREAQPIKLALRVEDGWWVATIRANDPNVQDHPVEVARINLNFMAAAPDGMARFQQLVTDALAGMLTDMGHPPVRVDINVVNKDRWEVPNPSIAEERDPGDKGTDFKVTRHDD